MPFDRNRADAACNFFEGILKHTADDYWGKPFLLAPWEEVALYQIFGPVDEDGSPLIELAYLEVPKKTGKTEFAAGVLLFVLVTATAPGFQAYGAAAATRQALNVYRAACKMVEQSPLLSEHLRIMRGTNRMLRRTDPDSFYAAVAADGDFGDGCNPGATVADEVHRWKTRKQLENWDVLSKGGITRRHSLTLAITTAGVPSESPLAWMLHEKTQRISTGAVKDPRFYGRIFGADQKDDPGDPNTWIKANPSLVENGGFLPLQKYREQYETAVSEGDLTAFKRYFLNIWDSKENRAIDMADWDDCAGHWKAEGLLEKSPEDTVRTFSHDYLARYFGRQCWAGVDLSMSTDTSALVFVFPNEEPDSYDILPFCYLPDGNIRKLEARLGVPLRQWAREGYLELSPGRVIDYREIQARLEWGAQMFDLREICWDPWNSRQISVPMIEAGHQCIEVRQGYQSLSEATKHTLKCIVRHRLFHGDHPVLRWHAGCASTVTDGKDNLMFQKPDRQKSTNRIDLLSALANAMSRAMVAQESGFGLLV